MNKFMDVDDALECVRQECEKIEVYNTLKQYIENLEQDVEALSIELETLESVPRHYKVREEDWR
jgi:prefoldin subunit 5